MFASVLVNVTCSFNLPLCCFCTFEEVPVFKKKDSVKTNLKFIQLYKNKQKKILYEDDLTYQTYRFDSVLLISDYYFPLLLLCGHIYT